MHIKSFLSPFFPTKFQKCLRTVEMAISMSCVGESVSLNPTIVNFPLLFFISPSFVATLYHASLRERMFGSCLIFFQPCIQILYLEGLPVNPISPSSPNILGRPIPLIFFLVVPTRRQVSP